MIKDIETIKRYLIGYNEVELPYSFKHAEEIKYITLKNNNESFYIGGTFVGLGNNCIILKNNFKRWSVPTFIFNKDGDIDYKSRFFVKENSDLDECHKVNKELIDSIKFQQKIIDTLVEKNSNLEKENSLLKKYINSK